MFPGEINIFLQEDKIYKEKDLDVLLFRSKFLKQKDYWAGKLAGEFNPTDILFGFGENKSAGKSGGENRTLLPAGLCNRLIKLSKGFDNSIYILLLTALKSLIYRYNFYEDVIVISPVNKFKVNEDTFNNLLYIRDQVDDNMSFKELVLRVRRSVLEAFENQDYPSGKLVKFIFPSPGEQDKRLISNIACSYGELHDDQHIKDIKVRLFFRFFKIGDRFECCVLYDEVSCNDSEVRQILYHYVNLLAKALEDVETKILDIPFLSEREKEQLIHDFNDNQADFPTGKTVYHFVEDQAFKIPHRVAVSFTGGGGSQVTYKVLNRRANQLARLFRTNSIREDQTVGILLERSVKMVESILAAWKAGAAYIPLDTDFPARRILEILDDSETGLLITGSNYIDGDFRASYNGVVISLDERLEAVLEGCNLNSGTNTHSLSYVIYTSGSTGKPKGAMVEHIGMMNHIQAKINDLQLTGKSITAQNSSHTFDISVWQFFVSLTLGGKTAIFPDELVFEPDKFISGIIAEKVTILEVVPGYLQTMLEFLDWNFRELNYLDYILVTGEEVKPRLVRRWFEKYPRISMINAYGPTEASDDITHFKIDKALAVNTIPIGKPIQNLNIYIVDKNMNLCPIGVKGEICVSGVGVGRGYLNDKIKTEEVFTIDTFRREEGIRLYKTGDLGRWLADGNIEFFGRKDFQVKIRGYRIELGEIESKLSAHPQVRESVVIVREAVNIDADMGGESDTYLCAYLVSNEKLDISSIKEYLSGRLPDYMIPTFFIQIESIPLTPNGKIARQALPHPGIVSGDEYTAPRNEIEEKLAGIWSKILEIEKERISIDANFFELGGHSLRATILIARIHKELDVKITLAQVFGIPTIRLLSEYIRQAEVDEYTSIKVAEKKEYYALSSAQQRLYILQQMELNSTNYNMPHTIPLREEIEKERFEVIFRKIISRHESLRTSFEMINDEPVQRVHEEVDFSIENYKAGSSEAGRKINMFTRPFDFSQAPLLRVGMMKIDSANPLLLFDLHHIITDGTSQDILTDEFLSLYLGNELHPLRLQYKDFAEWQNSRKQQELVKQQESYWLNLFCDQIPVLNIQTDYSRPLMQSFEGARVNFVLKEQETGMLREIAAGNSATIYMVMFSIYSILLAKLSGQEDIIIGTPTAGRRHADLESIIGMFINTLAVRSYPSGDKTFKEFLAEVKDGTLKSFENQEYQFEDLVERISPQRDTSRNPIFSVMFNLLNQEEYKGDIPELEEDGSYIHKAGTSKFDLNLRAVEIAEKLFFGLEYCTRLFKEKTIERMIGYFKKVVNTVIIDSNRKISDIEVIDEHIKKEIIVKFNKDPVDKFPIRTIQDKLFGSFLVHGNRIVLEYGEEKISYSKFEKRTNCITNWIIHNNIKKGSLIGILVNDRIELISLMIGILKAGCIFIPLETMFPVNRIKTMINLTNIQVLFLDDINKKRIVSIWEDLSIRMNNLIIDDSFYKIEGEHCLFRNNVQYHPHDKIYIYFTSGSTGVPKAIVGRNNGLLHFIEWEIDEFVVNEAYKFSQFVNPGFDVFLRDIFVPLCTGSTLAIPRTREIVLNIDEIGHWIDKCGIDAIHFVPSMFKILVSSNFKRDSFKSLRYITFSGENINPSILKKWYDIIGERVQLVFLYGSTETTLTSFYRIKKDDSLTKRIPVGQSIPGSEMILLDKNRGICDQGIAGEVHIKSPYRTFGYCNNPELNRYQFIPNPFNHDDVNEIIYKTGDLGRELPDGNIELIGRVDRQVKIRGIRIECGEIENLLYRHSKIKEVVVTTRGSEKEEIYLCAYIISGEDIPVSELREYLSLELPAFMIPSYFIRMERIPLTSSGKVNWKVLPDPEIKAGKDYIRPRDELDKKLVRIWSEVLGLEEDVISIDANFFELGGHSLKATILVAKIHKELGVKIPLAEVFRTSTIIGLALYIKKSEVDEYSLIRPVEEKEYYNLSSVQKRLYLLHEIGSRDYEINNTFELEANIDKKRLEKAFKDLITAHESLRTSFKMIEDKPVQVINKKVDFTIKYYEEGKLNNFEEAIRIKKIRDDFQRPFDLSEAPLLRVWMIKNEKNKYMILLKIHHIITDALSNNLLVSEVYSLYIGREPQPLILHYKDFSEWQNRFLESDEMKNQENYWLREFAGEIPIIQLPTDYERSGANGSGAVTFFIDKNGTEGLNKIRKGKEVTMFMIILAVYNILLSKLSGQDDIVVGTFLSGRDYAYLERIIGMYVKTLVLRNHPQENLTFKEFLFSVKEKVLDAFRNQDYPFDELVEKIQLDRKSGRNPLFDVAFNFLSDIGQELTENDKGEDQKMINYDMNSRFDLVLVAYEKRNCFQFAFDYNSRLFEEKTIERFVSYFKEIYSIVTADIDISLNDIKISHQLGIASADIASYEKNDFIF